MEEEIRRLTRGFLKLSETWSILADNSGDVVRAGATAYASKISEMYRRSGAKTFNASMKASVPWGDNEKKRLEELLNDSEHQFTVTLLLCPDFCFA